jgi:uncharacterized membrane protein
VCTVAMENPPRESRLDRHTSWVLIAGGLIGLVAAFELILEKVRVLADPNYVPACDINPVLSCGSVIITEQAEVFGFPNPVLGLIGFTVVITLGVVVVAGVSLPTWIWRGLNIGALAGFAFVHWLIWQSLYSIGSLCPWCMVVWAVTAPIFVWVTAANLAAGRLGVSSETGTAIAGLRWLVLFAWYLLVAALIFIRWQDFWIGGL